MRNNSLIKRIIALLAGLVIVFGVAACGGGGGPSQSGAGVSSETGSPDDGGSSETASESAKESESMQTECKFEDNVYEVDLCDDVTRSYIEAKTESEEFEIMRRYGGTSRDAQNKPFFTVKNGQPPFNVRYSENRDMTDAKTISTGTKAVEFGGTLYPGKNYYYEVSEESGKIVERGTVKTKDSPVRVINASGGRNIRDAGGWTTESGETVKYGLLYRGAQLNGRNGGPKLTDDGIKVFRGDLGMKTELDLRNTNDDGGQTACAFGSDKNYVKISITQYDIALKSNKAQFKEIFRMLANEDNYPVYYHCNAGADRTGTVAFLVGGLLGVSEKDLTKDFELTSFGGQGKRLRSDVKSDGYGDTGVYQNDSSNYVAWGKLVDYVKDNYTEGGKLSLSRGVEKYLLEAGVTQNDLNKVKVILLGLKEDETAPERREVSCERSGIKVYNLNGEKFTVEIPAKGHNFEISDLTATCKNCSLSGEYKALDTEYNLSFDISGALSVQNGKVSDKYGKTVTGAVKFAEKDGDKHFYVVTSGDRTIIAEVSVWSKIIGTESDLLAANDYVVKNAATGEISGDFLIANDIALDGKWAERNSIGYNENGYAFVGKIVGRGHTISGLKTESGAALCYKFGGEITNLNLKGEATEENAMFLCANANGGKISDVKIEVLLGEMPLEKANSALLGNIGEGGDMSEIILKNVVIIESSATEKLVNRNRSSAIGKLFDESHKNMFTIDGLTIVGVRPVLTTTSGATVNGEKTFAEFFGENNEKIKNVKVYNSIAAYNAAK